MSRTCTITKTCTTNRYWGDKKSQKQIEKEKKEKQKKENENLFKGKPHRICDTPSTSQPPQSNAPK